MNQIILKYQQISDQFQRPLFKKKISLEIIKFGIKQWQNCTQEPVCFFGGRAKCERFFQRKIGVYQSRKVRGTKKHNYTKTRLVNFGHI